MGNQIELFGEGTARRLKEVLGMFRANRIMLVTGSSSFRLSGAEEIIMEQLSGHESARFTVNTECPQIEFIKKGIELIREFLPDTVIAAGGGNVIDTAKAINFLSAQSNNPEEVIENSARATEKGRPLVAIPTTSGSGSEATHFAVVYSGISKFSLASDAILPDAAIVDPELTYSLTPYQTAVSGIDAFCQAIESIWATGSNEESTNYAEESAALSYNNLLTAVSCPDAESRRNLSRASNLAGKAINISRTTAPHAVSYTMTSVYGIPHGQAVCITLGEFLKYISEVTEDDCNDRRGAEHVRNAVRRILRILNAKDPEEGRGKINALIEDCGLQTTLTGLGINGMKEIEQIALNTNAERLGNNPRKITQDKLLEIMKRVH
ncbi:MAG: phosphonoacetaldehyde reductase [Ignavibacteria bacterium]|nr:phosphonoacetaldehyde reductase [Ignavibacteria bacterium]